MSASFFDSNVVLYLVASDPAKAQQAREIVNRGGIISVQVLNESANVLRRKRSLAWPEIKSFTSHLRRRLEVHPVTLDIHHSGLRLAERYGFAIYDSFIVAAALSADCDTLWSEDMQDGMVVDGRLTITNPFPATPLQTPSAS
jgi:predicted nucleic acid-binding protein